MNRPRPMDDVRLQLAPCEHEACLIVDPLFFIGGIGRPEARELVSRVWG